MIKIGPAGSGMGNIDSLQLLKNAGLDAVEVEFTYGVWMKEVDAKKFGQEAKRLGISLSIHAPYYINLASKEKDKVLNSMKRIIDSARIGHLLGATAIVFHAGFYQDKDKDEIFEEVKNAIIHIQDSLDSAKIKINLAPEVTGKPTQFGSVDELLKLHDEIKTGITVDFAHLIARNQGTIDYDVVFDSVKRLKKIHSHFSGIEWTAKGERRHLPTQKQEALKLIRSAVSSRMDLTIINESPMPFEDAVMMKKVLSSIK